MLRVICLILALTLIAIFYLAQMAIFQATPAKADTRIVPKPTATKTMEPFPPPPTHQPYRVLIPYVAGEQGEVIHWPPPYPVDCQWINGVKVCAPIILPVCR